ncbi:P-loop containing nucleoside triphosphate hydrolase protein [Pavlovales sp. CCMP2436]|nr:P-loop containing nucleoside triphosphate hydrolase protein [Pavlovales sp. CCMP2436]
MSYLHDAFACTNHYPHLAVLPQEPLLLRASVRDNLSVYRQGPSVPRAPPASSPEPSTADSVRAQYAQPLLPPTAGSSDAMAGGSGGDWAGGSTGAKEGGSGGEQAGDAGLWLALDRVGLAQLVRTWPRGLDTILAAGGGGAGGGDSGRGAGGVEPGGGERTLSSGERALLAAARLFAHPSCCVAVVDEASASLDADSEAKLERAIASLPCTVLAVCHRLKHIRGYHRVIVMESGRIIEDGSPDELLARPSSHLRALVDGVTSVA